MMSAAAVAEPGMSEMSGHRNKRGQEQHAGRHRGQAGASALRDPRGALDERRDRARAEDRAAADADRVDEHRFADVFLPFAGSFMTPARFAVPTSVPNVSNNSTNVNVTMIEIRAGVPTRL